MSLPMAHCRVVVDHLVSHRRSSLAQSSNSLTWKQRVSGVHCRGNNAAVAEAIGRVNGKSVEATNAIQNLKVKAMEKLKPSSLRRDAASVQRSD